MDTIVDFVFNFANFPAKLGDFILEESHQLNQQIKDNITKLSIFTVGYYDYIPDIVSSSIMLTFALATIAGFGILYWNSKTAKKYSPNQSIALNKGLNSRCQPFVIKKGLYLQSIIEVNDASKNIVKNFKKGQIYWVLIRAQMKDYVKMFGTKFELHGNNIHKDTDNTMNEFKTKDVYLIMKFKIINDIKDESLVGNVIVQFMNDYNHGNFTTNDFIICAIGTSSKVDPYEFLNGLKHINYELKNRYYINKTIQKLGIISCYSLLLPINKVYNLFMDIYNNCVFESTKYKIDNNNYEFWNSKSINEIAF